MLVPWIVFYPWLVSSTLWTTEPSMMSSLALIQAWITPMGDKERICPQNINAISRRQVIKKEHYQIILSWSNTKFFWLTLQELYGGQWRELPLKSWELKVFEKFLLTLSYVGLLKFIVHNLLHCFSFLVFNDIFVLSPA